MKILIKVIRFIFVFFLFSLVMTIIREARIPYLIYVWFLVGGYYVLWEFGLLKKKGKPGSQKNKRG